MKKSANYTVQWSKIRDENQMIMVFDENKRTMEDKLIGHFAFDDIACYVKGYSNNNIDYEEFPKLEDFQRAINKRVGIVIDWQSLDEYGGGSIKIIY